MQACDHARRVYVFGSKPGFARVRVCAQFRVYMHACLCACVLMSVRMIACVFARMHTQMCVRVL